MNPLLTHPKSISALGLLQSPFLDPRVLCLQERGLLSDFLPSDAQWWVSLLAQEDAKVP